MRSGISLHLLGRDMGHVHRDVCVRTSRLAVDVHPVGSLRKTRPTVAESRVACRHRLPTSPRADSLPTRPTG